jgi:hypothetical protein
MLALIFITGNTGVLEFLRSHVVSLSPLSRFIVALAAILVMPPLSRRVKLRLWSDYSSLESFLGPLFSISSEKSAQSQISWPTWASCY